MSVRKLIIVLALIAAFTFAANAEQAPSVGGTMYLGGYEQDNNTENGVEPIEWIVLEEKDGTALLVSKYALDCGSYNETKGDIDWENCTLRAWLNRDFIEAAFTDAERACLVENKVANDRGEGSAEWDTDGGADTVDMVYLPSQHDIAMYFKGGDSYKTQGTEYARALGAKFLGVTTIGVDKTDWWLRSPGRKQNQASCVGTIRDIKSADVDGKNGIRPMIRIELSTDRAGFRYEQMTEADRMLESGDYEGARNALTALTDYWNSTAKTVNINRVRALQEQENGNFEAAIGYFESSYAQAVEYGLPDSDDYLNDLLECHYARAIAEKEAGNLEKAVEYFEAYDNETEKYEHARNDSYQTDVPECYYELANRCYDAGDYAGALDNYSEITGYLDSMDRVFECLRKTGAQWQTIADGTAAVNAGVNTGYSKEDKISGKDIHFGWYLGEFIVSGYTREENNAGVPVFIKTNGDKLVLWFKPEQQNIDALNGNDKLSIDADEKGYDEKFGITKTNFGRGTLILQFTDHTGHKNDPVLYTDFLAAGKSGVANTRVELKEEGRYSGALDYQVKSASLIPKTGGYRIPFEFEVKNGSSMAFIFDVNDGAELEDYSVTVDGFKIEMANSHSLNASVKRYALNQDGTGLDLRQDEPIRNGEKFEKTGYYEITSTNTETGETVEKHIFVGRSGDLQEYKAVDDRLNRFS